MWCSTRRKLINSRGRITMLLLPVFGLPYLLFEEVTTTILDTPGRNPTSKTRMDTDAEKRLRSVTDEAMKMYESTFDTRQEAAVREAAQHWVLQPLSKSANAAEGDEVDVVKLSQNAGKNEEKRDAVRTHQEGRKTSHEEVNSVEGHGEQARVAKVDEVLETHTSRNQESLVPQSVRTGQAVAGRAASHVLLLASMGRSGSSFLGGLLTSQRRVFYFFEPLLGLKKRGRLTQESAVQGIQALVSCNITGPISEAVRDRSFPVLRTCHQGCYEEEQVRQQCLRHPIRVIKSIRTRVAWLQPLLIDPAIDLKVIHLVRDPRASLISAWRLNWTITARDACTRIDQDMAAGITLTRQYSQRFLAVRYEDLCVAPTDAAHTIFSYLGYSALPLSVQRFMKRFTSGKDHGRTFGIRRNSKEMQQQWRSRITQEQLTAIEKECGRTINALGFSLFRTVPSARNLTLRLYKGGGKDSYFTVPGE